MENFFATKYQKYPSDLTPFETKVEDHFTENPSSPIIKKEEETRMELDYTPLDPFDHLKQINKRSEQLFDNLSQYLDHFIDVEDFELPFIFQKSKEAHQIIIEAKVHFREWGNEIIKSLREDMKNQSVHHFFPDTHIVRITETTKRRIFASYKELKKRIIEALINSKKNENPKKSEPKPEKPPRKSKYDFPLPAQNILRHWFIAHAEDPYPTHEEKIELARKGSISMRQLDNWFTNTRGRIWKQTQKDNPKFGKQIAEVLHVKTEII